MVVGLARRIDAHGIQTNEDGLRRAGSAKFNPSNFGRQHQQHPQAREGTRIMQKGLYLYLDLYLHPIHRGISFYCARRGVVARS
jgi:hypothetical protein